MIQISKMYSLQINIAYDHKNEIKCQRSKFSRVKEDKYSQVWLSGVSNSSLIKLYDKIHCKLSCNCTGNVQIICTHATRGHILFEPKVSV